MGSLLVLSQAVDPLWTVFTLGLCFLAVGMAFLLSFGKGDDVVRLGHYAPVIHSLLYVPFILQMALYLTPSEQVLIMLAPIASDTGGYYAGSLYGKRKLWPRVSPKKTWEGYFGGLILCALACMLFGMLGNALDWRMLQAPFWIWLFIGIVMHHAALSGDLFESALKRTLNVKDSGTLLPGHGGVLDRIDSLLFAIPVFLALRHIFRLLPLG